MAVIGKIQKNSLLLLIVIGGAMLAFIFSDLFSNIGAGEEPTPTATISGDVVDDDKLTKLNEQFIYQEKNRLYQQNKLGDWNNVTEKATKDQAFNEYIRRELMNKELEALGIDVSDEELNDMIVGDHTYPWVKSNRRFQDATGSFSKDSLVKYIKILETEPNGQDTTQYNAWKDEISDWKKYEQELKTARKTDKYVTLAESGIYVNKLEAKDAYVSANEKRDISFVIKKYTDIKDITEVTDEELKTYFEAHKTEKKYKNTDDGAKIDFVNFPVNITQSDKDAALESMNRLKKSFSKSTNDIAFIYNNSSPDPKFYSDSTVFKLGSDDIVIQPGKDNQPGNFLYPSIADEAIQAADSGDVVGPFLTKNKAMIFKIKGFETEEMAWVRHILVKFDTRTEAQAKKKADSLVRVINDNDNFIELVATESEDGGSIASNGEYKWFTRGAMVAPFEKASFEGAKDKLQVVKTQYGYHIVEVIDVQSRKKPILAAVVKEIKPGIQTRKDVEDLAYEFIATVNDQKGDSAFFKVANQDSLSANNTKITMRYTYVMGYDAETAIERIKKFAFAKDAMEGDISDPIYDEESGNYKVALLSSKSYEGEPKFEDVKEQMRFPALRDKQAQVYIKMMSEGKPESLQELVAKIPDLKIQNATVTFNSNTIVGGGGSEPEVIGVIFALPAENKGAMLSPVQGTSGIYTIIVDNIESAPETTDYSKEVTEILTNRVSKVSGEIIKSLREQADIKDNRAKIDIQGR